MDLVDVGAYFAYADRNRLAGGVAGREHFARPLQRAFDVDADGQLDTFDWYGLQGCYARTGGRCAELFDADGSGGVGQADVVAFEAEASGLFGGPQRPRWRRGLIASRYGKRLSPRKEAVGMRLLLASKDRYRLLLMLDPVQHALEFAERRRFDNARWEEPPISGWFGMIDGVFGAIYVAQRQLFVKLNYQTVPIEPDIISRWENVPFGNRFALQRGSEVIVEVEYGRPSVQAPDLFDRVEEDRDFWLYVHKLLSVPGKREKIITLWDRNGVENQMGEEDGGN